ncbi:MAG: alpha/beta hydrolase [Sciscionella sp.]
MLLFDLDCFGLSTCADDGKPHYLDDVAASIKRLKAEGAHSVSVVGASLGGSIAFASGARLAGSLRAVADLSGDELTTDVGGGAHPVTASSAAANMRLPVLFATAPDDRYLTLADARDLAKRTASSDKRLLVQPEGAGHGWDMLVAADGGWTALATKLATFLRTHAG